VELDEGFVGGKRGRGAPGKTIVAVSAQQTPGGGLANAHMQVVDDATADSLVGAAWTTIEVGSAVRTDGHRGYLDLAGAGYDHQGRVLPTGPDIDDWLPWSHIVLSNFKRWTLGTFHGVSPHHLQAYLDEFCYRLNRRGDRHDLFRRILNRCVLYTDPAPYSLLTAT
jgi:hypothetical protein